MAKFVAHLLATAALWVRIQASLKNTKWATLAKEWPTHSSPPKNIQKKIHTKAEDSFWDIVFLNPLQLFIIF